MYMYAPLRNRSESLQCCSCRKYSTDKCVCVCLSERVWEHQKKRMWGINASLYCWSLTHLSPISFLCHNPLLSLLPSWNLLLHFCLFSGGVWIHHGQLGLRSSHNDWRTVHLQPQGGGPHLPSLQRWHRVRFTGAAAFLDFLGGHRSMRAFLSGQWSGWELFLKGLGSIMPIFRANKVTFSCFIISVHHVFETKDIVELWGHYP